MTEAELAGGRLRLTGKAARHLGGALRVRPGEELVAVTPDGVEHLCAVRSAAPDLVEADELEERPGRNEPRLHVRVAAALLKGDQLERLVEAASEVGAASFQAVLADRSIARLDPARLEQRMGRWRDVARSGAEVGQRDRLPEVLPPGRLPEVLDTAGAAGLHAIVLYEGSGLPSLSEVDLGDAGICLLVGPEGGWAPAEIEVAASAGAETVTLGPRIMRPLPAALTALGVVLHRAGELTLNKEAP